ncbi:MAG: bifunctional pyr operon transcriptional regulator/uracil phosphoribosyltransferase PyrR [Candidatus Omnitrophica bacterium]|nr:bifunctional pyr operon transcriptional regulator/uracil phosphoribosyltransferase PyrR [Candidatus Omnitrophota bacterium]
MPESQVLLDSAAIKELVGQIARKIGERKDGAEVVLVGIQRGGVLLAERLGRILSENWKQPVPVGRLDVNMHRDDLDQRPVPEVYPTVIPFDITGKRVILVDDVLFKGRTVRAAMDALNDFGRPQRIELAVLIDRGHRELPIQPDYVGREIATKLQDTVHVRFREEGGGEAVYLESA